LELFCASKTSDDTKGKGTTWPDPASDVPPAIPSVIPHDVRGKKHSAASEDPTAELSHESEDEANEDEDEDTPKKVSTTGASVASEGSAARSSTLPTVQVSAASPPKAHLTFAVGGVSRMCLYFHSCILTYPIEDVWPKYHQGKAMLHCTT
jgi:hypothetical protein